MGCNCGKSFSGRGGRSAPQTQQVKVLTSPPQPSGIKTTQIRPGISRRTV